MLVLALGCPGSPVDTATPPPVEYDTGFALYQAPGEGWTGLDAVDYEAVALDGPGRVTFSACDDDTRCTDGACRRDCTDSPGWWEGLGALGLVHVPGFGGDRTYGMDEPWLVVEASGTTWRRTDSDPPEARQAVGWEIPTSVGQYGSCWCASFAEREAACDCQGSEADRELVNHVSGATAVAGSPLLLGFVRGDGTAGFVAFGGLDPALYGELADPPYVEVSTSGALILTLDEGALLSLGYVGSGPAASELALVPEPGEVSAFAAGFDEQCWIDPGGQLHFSWAGGYDPEPGDGVPTPLHGPRFAAVPSALLCGAQRGCALVDGHLQCWAMTWNGEPVAPLFEGLMLTSGARLQ